jgi:hypothetical protein
MPPQRVVKQLPKAIPSFPLLRKICASVSSRHTQTIILFCIELTRYIFAAGNEKHNRKMENSSIDIKMSKLDRVYHPKQKVEGIIVVNAFKGWAHNGVVLSAEALIHLNPNGRGLVPVDLGTKPTQIFKLEKDILPAGKFADGVFELPFEFNLKAIEGQTLVESYHGVYISIIYTLSVTCERGMMKKALRKDLEFIVEVPNPPSVVDPLPVPFNISPDSLENVNETVLATIPKFKITGKLHKSRCPINQPVTGEFMIQESFSPIRSIELQLVRVETVISPNRTLREATEIQNIQIGDGNICRSLSVPMYMVFPRLFSCPTYSCPAFKIEFEINLVVVFSDGYMITENFPLQVYRE